MNPVETRDKEAFSIYRDYTSGYPLFVWKQLPEPQDFNVASNEWKSYMNSQVTKRFIVDTQNIPSDCIGENPPETWVPEVMKTDVQYGAGVFRSVFLEEYDVSRFESSVNSVSPEYDFRAFRERSEAYEWLKSAPASSHPSI